MIVAYYRYVILLLLMGLTIGCAYRSSPFEDTLEAQVTPDILFSHVSQDPSGHIGQIIKAGGEVLSAKRLVDRTEVMVLQVPLDSDSVPKWNRTKSKGRFIATQQAFLDPATLPHGTRLTIIGEVTGQASVQVDEEEKVYPVLSIKALKVWPMIPPSMYGYRPYWGPYPYWGSPWFYPRSPFYYGFPPLGRHRGRH